MLQHLSTKQIINYSLFTGLVAGVLFIAFQSLFAMGTITGRHAQSYIEMGAYSLWFATTMAWLVHLLVSVIYAFLSTLIFSISNTKWVTIIQTLILAWLSTLIATPANVFVMKLLGTKSIPALSSLPALNTNIDMKLALHLVFFVLVIAMLYVLNKRSKKAIEIKD